MAKKKRASKFSDVIIILVFFFGLGVFAYPFVANAVNDLANGVRLNQARQQVKQNVAREATAAKQANAKWREHGIQPDGSAVTQTGGTKATAAYRAKHLIGSVELPTIGVGTLLFDRTNETLLQAGATVLPGTSYPTGGKGNHTVISAHSGIPGKDFFSKLERLKQGDVFVLTVGKRKLAYKVFRRQTVKPKQTDVLQAEPGRDLATLMTCTPIGINSHRFLVTGYRVPYTPAVAKQVAAAKARRTWWHWALIAGAVLAAVLAGWLLVRAWRKRR